MAAATLLPLKPFVYFENVAFTHFSHRLHLLYSSYQSDIEIKRMRHSCKIRQYCVFVFVNLYFCICLRICESVFVYLVSLFVYLYFWTMVGEESVREALSHSLGERDREREVSTVSQPNYQTIKPKLSNQNYQTIKPKLSADQNPNMEEVRPASKYHYHHHHNTSIIFMFITTTIMMMMVIMKRLLIPGCLPVSLSSPFSQQWGL